MLDVIGSTPAPAPTPSTLPDRPPVEITEKKPEDEDDPYVYIPSLTGETYNITPGAKDQKVEVIGKVPVDDVKDLPPPPPTEIPKLDPLPIPEVKVEDKPAKGGINVDSILSLLSGLAGSGQQSVSSQQPTPSQVLANMKPFDVDSLSQFLQEEKREAAAAQAQQSEQEQLFAMLEAMGFKG